MGKKSVPDVTGHNEIVAKYIVNFAKNYLYKRLPIYLTCCNI
jgi:hypothetical protein